MSAGESWGAAGGGRRAGRRRRASPRSGAGPSRPVPSQRGALGAAPKFAPGTAEQPGAAAVTARRRRSVPPSRERLPGRELCWQDSPGSGGCLRAPALGWEALRRLVLKRSCGPTGPSRGQGHLPPDEALSWLAVSASGQPVPLPHRYLSENLPPNVYPKSPLCPLKAVPPCPVIAPPDRVPSQLSPLGAERPVPAVPTCCHSSRFPLPFSAAKRAARQIPGLKAELPVLRGVEGAFLSACLSGCVLAVLLFTHLVH